ncbi:flagellar motor switch protein FliG [Porticoccus sp. W117]|uniref:flagellar motor switch protein FliG n=1 Tax=Porticoccus sp. W117 TaxID=3054777 RepID=UPI0025944543|nr:flagellar motor switch protein FliG [Porticoccus sp. W117]MDM3870192.1 flagellar motor switch protein FliG [Porticoccus sp. W117]
MSADLSKLDKAALLLAVVGEEYAAGVFRYLHQSDVQRIGQAMKQLKRVNLDEIKGAIGEFLEETTSSIGFEVGTEDYIRDTLTKAVGEVEAKRITSRIFLNDDATGLDALKLMPPRAIADLIQGEHPQIQATVVSYLEPEKGAEVLAFLDSQTRLDIVMRVVSLQPLHPDAMKELSEVLDKQLDSSSPTTGESTLGGLKTVAAIVNSLDTAQEEELMEKLNELDAEMAVNIQQLMFVFDDLVGVPDREFQALVQEIQMDQLVIALKGADQEVKDKVFRNMSKRAAEMLREDMEAGGPVKVSEVETAQREIMVTAKRLLDEGKISIAGGAEMVG